jgi:hypothetical protein
MNDQQTNTSKPGLFLNLDELKILFSSLKAHEDDLSRDAGSMLVKIERLLYDYLTIGEIESLLEK